MEEILKSISEKISSYNIFNNLFPGIIFCSVMTKITRFNFATDTIIEQFFMWYFIGMVISRIGSIFVEDTLKKIKIKGKTVFGFCRLQAIYYCLGGKSLHCNIIGNE